MDESPVHNPEVWVPMEYTCSPINLKSVLCAPTPPPLSHLLFNPIIYHSVSIWFQFRKHFTLQSTSILSPIKNNYNFPFGTWHSKGIKSISDLYIDDKFGSFTQLYELFNLPHSLFLNRYLQIHNLSNLQTGEAIDHVLSPSPHCKHLVSTLYNYIDNLVPHSTEDTKNIWDNQNYRNRMEDSTQPYKHFRPVPGTSWYNSRLCWGCIWPGHIGKYIPKHRPLKSLLPWSACRLCAYFWT